MTKSASTSHRFQDQLNPFLEFISESVEPARKEIEPLKDSQRRHIQKLLFVNLVDRFDYTLDLILLSLWNDEKFQEKRLLKSVAGQQVSRSEFLSYFLMKDEARKSKIQAEIEGLIRKEVIRENHEKKLRILLEELLSDDDFKSVDKPRVHEGTGEIMGIRGKGHDTIPLSVPGYAGDQYERRNAIVHRNGKRKDGSDVKVSPGSIKNAAKFYQDLAEIIGKGAFKKPIPVRKNQKQHDSLKKIF